MSGFFRNEDSRHKDNNHVPEEPPVSTGTMPAAVRFTENQWITELEEVIRERVDHRLKKYSCERTEHEVSSTMETIVAELSGLKERVYIIQEEEKRKEELLSKQRTEQSALNDEKEAFTDSFEELFDIKIEEWSNNESHKVFMDLNADIKAAFDKAKQALEDVHADAEKSLESDDLNTDSENVVKIEEAFDDKEISDTRE